MDFCGVFTAVVTPFADDLSFDDEKFVEFIEWQIAEGITGLVPCGTTGEYSTLDFEEYCRVVELCVGVAKGRVPVIAGTGSNSTAEAMRRTLFAQSAAADAAMVVIPYYNRPSAEGIYQHFREIHNATKIPLIVYNVPKRSAVEVSDEVIAKIAQLPRVVGIKDATGDITKALNLRLMSSKEITLLSGDDATTLAFSMYGGNGCISVISNVVPKLAVELDRSLRCGDLSKAQQINRTLFRLTQVMFCESSPTPTKYALSLLGKMSPKVRLPLVELREENKRKVEEALKDLGL